MLLFSIPIRSTPVRAERREVTVSRPYDERRALDCGDEDLGPGRDRVVVAGLGTAPPVARTTIVVPRTEITSTGVPAGMGWWVSE